MRRIATLASFLGAAALGAAALAGAAQAQMLGNASSYNTPFGMSSNSSGNQPIDPSLRDSNGNMTMVNGEFTSSAFAQGYGMASSSTLGNTPGVSSSGAAYGGATAIGNQLNVVTVGTGNTVIVNANQTNNGNQTANTTINGQ
jgi:holdfast attachment protein HfaA